MIKQLLRRYLRRKPETTLLPLMTEAERLVVQQFASGDTSVRARAIEAYREARKRGVPLDSDAAMRFMFEVDHTNPDLNIRIIMRKEVLAAVT